MARLRIRQWLERFFVGLDRTDAFAIDRRFPALLERGGAVSVLGEIDQMHSAHARATYLTRLVREAPLDEAAVRRVAFDAASLGPSHPALEVIIQLAARTSLSDPVAREACLRTALSATAEYDGARALVAILAKTPLDASEADSVRAGASRMRSNFGRGQVLDALARQSGGL
jgi:hypothetical protein